MTYTDQDKAIALIGIYQVSQQVFQLATTGKTDEKAYEATINSLFCENPQDTLDVFGGDVANIQLGVNTLLSQMSSNQAVSSRNIEITKYVLSLMILEKNVSKTDGALQKVSRVIESARAQREHFNDFHENVIATLARAYSENISQISPRIIVNGQHGHLQNPKTANKIRALLLAGIRASLLWRQVGGTRWGLLWYRKKYLKSAQSLYRVPLKNEFKSFDDNEPPSSHS
ncbi:high frequency lysogenization protein HflD [Hydrogenovibrio sp. 3SP14C1]|uniref:high frequency lysogenization protein HflD n=1 Tax=Hydrogenovibrio sp. 3SP14C1 TaxID=3038774 RepID=UPI0024171D8F|nr:high frequency lysogenization protein HflD [Hydrogenovibrio sp. 3SP14C1]MDG4813396.1 high frequency lysogenization protein HflD [Hydrogenovibrio sp. 3SP14C1]